MPTLNRHNKFDVKEGDTIRFYGGKHEYIVTTIIPTFYPHSDVIRGVSFSIQDKETKQTIYCYPSSQLYGAEWIPQD